MKVLWTDASARIPLAEGQYAVEHGQVVDLPARAARALIEQGSAQPVDEPTKRAPKRKAPGASITTPVSTAGTDDKDLDR